MPTLNIDIDPRKAQQGAKQVISSLERIKQEAIEVANTIDIAGSSFDRMRNQARASASAFARMQTATVRMEKAAEGLTDATQAYTRISKLELEQAKKRIYLNTLATQQVKKFHKEFDAGTSSLTKYTMLITSLSASFLVMRQAMMGVWSLVERGIEFERSMMVVAAVSRATAMEFEALGEAARNAGKATVWTASQAAEALRYMAWPA